MIRLRRRLAISLICLVVGPSIVVAGEVSTQQGLGYAAMTKRNFREAIDHFSRAIDAFPPESVKIHDGGFFPFRPEIRLLDLYLSRSSAYSQLNEHAHALTDLDAADRLRLEKDKVDQLFIGIARASCLFLLRRFDESISEFERVARLDSKFADGCKMGQAGVMIAAGRLEPAAAALDQIPPNSKVRFEAEAFRAIIRLALHDCDGATRIIDEALRRSPRDGTVLQARSVILMARKQYDEAYKAASEEIRLAPKSPLGWSTRAAALAMMDRYPEALADVEEALRLDPRSVICLKNRASARKEVGDERGAIEDLIRAAELKPDDAEIDRRLANLLARSKDPALRDIGRAVELAERAVARSSRKSPFCLETLAVIRFDQGRYAEALTMAEEAMALLPNATAVEWDVHLGTDWIGIGFYVPFRDEEKFARDLRAEIDRYRRIVEATPRSGDASGRFQLDQATLPSNDPLFRPTTIERSSP